MIDTSYYTYIFGLNCSLGISTLKQANLSVGISSLAGLVDGLIEERQLEISWYDIQAVEGDKIAIFLEETISSECLLENSTLVEEILINDINQNWTRANTSLPNLSYEELKEFQHCIMYWVAYIRQGQIIGCSCLKTEPNWMWNLRDQISSKKLRELFLPGTHDAASYDTYRGTISNNIATKYAIAQGESLINQLLYGVRYLDIRIVFRPTTEARFWTCHSAYVLRPLVNDTQLVAKFLAESADIVIFDIHDLDGFSNSSAHEELSTFLLQEFGEWLAPADLTWEATLDDFWSTDKRLIVTYNDNYQSSIPYLWPAVQHQLGNVNDDVSLEIYLESIMDKAANGLLPFAWSSMAELTPTPADVLQDSLGGLRNAADLVNRNVTRWFRNQWNSIATIVATDFFLGNNIVDIAIRENQRRAIN